jgi:hypothetical protein
MAREKLSVKFNAQVKKIQMLIDVCGDKGGKVELIFRDERQTLQKLNKLMRSDREVKVTIEE